MSIYYSGTYRRSSGVLSAIVKQLKSLTLKPVKKIEVSFDPFHPNALTARDFLFHIQTPKVLETNLSCSIKPLVVCDRSDISIKVHLLDNPSYKTVELKANNLNVLEILQQFNQHITPLAKEEEVKAIPVTKSEKKRRK